MCHRPTVGAGYYQSGVAACQFSSNGGFFNGWWYTNLADAHGGDLGHSQMVRVVARTGALRFVRFVYDPRYVMQILSL